MEKNNTIPADGLRGLRENFKFDILSGFMVFLIALPLCLGISKASGFPPIAGIYTAIVGGAFVALFSGSPLTIKGPAAGLIVISLGAVETLGKGDMIKGYELALATIVVAGAIQVLFGVLKLGRWSDFFPSSAVHGMLAAIGIIIFSKQIHVLMGVTPQAKSPLALIAEIPHSVMNMNPKIALIGFVSLLVLFGMPLIKNKAIKNVPAALIVLLFSIPTGIFFELGTEHEYSFAGIVSSISPQNALVNLPDSFLAGITFPDFSEVLSFDSIKYILMFALIGSLESLLSSKAIDTLDPYHRKSKLDKDLVAVGMGNMLAGFIGGLPMISEIVRSSANVNNGGKTRWANFFHGLFLLLFVAFATGIVKTIPMAALAAMLVFTGYRLASPKQFYATYQIGLDELIVFVATIITTLATDLLVGIAVGVVVELFIDVLWGVPLKALFSPNIKMDRKLDGSYVIKIKDAAIFSNYISIRDCFDKIPKEEKVTVDLHEAVVVDHSFLEHLHEIQQEKELKGGIMEVIGLENHDSLSDHPLCAKRMRSH